ncbi:40S ribosomal protein S25 [Thelohanellus kitauei]|uniref:40S ribosomal protein S25 n=1 Tax=Thelohanellus kitauei TaxID=669202 RepID=A0A0C2J2K4_THEKT|nr:40S ribosomal protein S25 [Thelohanellus kitauei]
MVTKKPDPKKAGTKDKKKIDKTKIVMKKMPKTGGSKIKKKKWSKGKMRDKLENQAFLDQSVYDKTVKEIGKMTLITPATVSEKFKLKVSVARHVILDMAKSNLCRIVNKSRSGLICTKPHAPSNPATV